MSAFGYIVVKSGNGSFEFGGMGRTLKCAIENSKGYCDMVNVPLFAVGVCKDLYIKEQNGGIDYKLIEGDIHMYVCESPYDACPPCHGASEDIALKLALECVTDRMERGCLETRKLSQEEARIAIAEEF